MAEPLSLADRFERDFTYHPPKDDQPLKYAAIRLAAKQLASVIASATLPSREQSLAITRVEEAVMWANAAVARHTE